MTQLIVALDTEQSLRHIVALRQAGVTFFKLNTTTIMEPSFFDILHLMGKLDADWFADLKVYDTRDTVERIARRAFDLGARFLTVHATPSMLAAAMRAKPAGDYHKILAVGTLTDGSGYADLAAHGTDADGVVVSVDVAGQYRGSYGGMIVCPGIRPLTTSSAIVGAHVAPATPAEAKAAGADYIVVGRPIIDAPDPAAAARAIMEELV